MRKLFAFLSLISLLAGNAWAGVVLGTSNPPGTPLLMSPGTTSGPMYADVVSNNFPQDVMSAWNFELEIVPTAGSTGSLVFQDPATGTPANPPNYIFDGNGLGIVATNGGSTLRANDFFNPAVGVGVPVPGTPGANLLMMDFRASSNAAGLFGIYAVEGNAVTQWSDSNLNTQFFTNVPNGTGTVLIGEVLVVAQAVPEPSVLELLGLAGVTLAGCWWWNERKQAPAPSPV